MNIRSLRILHSLRELQLGARDPKRRDVLGGDASAQHTGASARLVPAPDRRAAALREPGAQHAALPRARRRPTRARPPHDPHRAHREEGAHRRRSVLTSALGSAILSRLAACCSCESLDKALVFERI